MTTSADDLVPDILAAIRRVIRAIDLDSKRLMRDHRITGPQLLVLRAVNRMGPTSVTALAREVNLSQPNVTGILTRLEQQRLIRRAKSDEDRRQVTCVITTDGLGVLRDTPTLLEDRFRRELTRIEDWEQTQLLASLQRIASMMEAEDIVAGPILTTESNLAGATTEPAAIPATPDTNQPAKDGSTL